MTAKCGINRWQPNFTARDCKPEKNGHHLLFWRSWQEGVLRPERGFLEGELCETHIENHMIVIKEIILRPVEVIQQVPLGIGAMKSWCALHSRSKRILQRKLQFNPPGPWTRHTQYHLIMVGHKWWRDGGIFPSAFTILADESHTSPGPPPSSSCQLGESPNPLSFT